MVRLPAACARGAPTTQAKPANTTARTLGLLMPNLESRSIGTCLIGHDTLLCPGQGGGDAGRQHFHHFESRVARSVTAEQLKKARYEYFALIACFPVARVFAGDLQTLTAAQA
jgi:hypothetical protein